MARISTYGVDAIPELGDKVEPFATPDYLEFAIQTNSDKYAYVRFCRDY